MQALRRAGLAGLLVEADQGLGLAVGLRQGGADEVAEDRADDLVAGAGEPGERAVEVVVDVQVGEKKAPPEPTEPLSDTGGVAVPVPLPRSKC